MAGKNGQRNGSQHEDDGTPCCYTGKNRSSSAWTKGCLAAHSAKGSSNISALPVLKQHHYDEDGTDDYVDNGDQDIHAVSENSFQTIGAEGGI